MKTANKNMSQRGDDKQVKRINQRFSDNFKGNLSQ